MGFMNRLNPIKETLENPATMRENDLVIAGVD
jgi:hypothetical protein